MRTFAATLVLAAVAVGCGGGDGTSATSGTQLRITAWPQGRGESEPRRWTLRCNPAGGTLPNAARACSRLAALERPFRPIPPDVACTEIYGGPQEALVSGTYRGNRVWARFNRTNGCHIARWERVRFLFPIPVGVTVDR